MMGAVSFDEQITSGKAKFVGNRDVYEQLKSMLVHFDLGFEIMPGTGSFKQEELGRTDGG
jgi:alkyl sulfatase BDS1-like metallo-beta-lactamase superfamily hydrolase